MPSTIPSSTNHLILHVAVKAFLWSIIPAVPFAGHALSQTSILGDLYELKEAALIASSLKD